MFENLRASQNKIQGKWQHYLDMVARRHDDSLIRVESLDGIHGAPILLNDAILLIIAAGNYGPIEDVLDLLKKNIETQQQEQKKVSVCNCVFTPANLRVAGRCGPNCRYSSDSDPYLEGK
jgi:hypothetical protein